jgi:hypothetical protein
MHYAAESGSRALIEDIATPEIVNCQSVHG